MVFALQGDLSKLKFDDNGLIPAVIQDWQDNQVLMVAYMNRESLEKTLATGQTWFYSRSRKSLWHKGATSGHYQLVKEISYDCDGDCLLIKVEQLGPGACHEGYRSCFHYPLLGEAGEGQTFSPESVYGPAVLSELYQVILQRRGASPDESYTARLFAGGLDRILKKVGEEAAEVIIAAKNGEAKFLIEETADLLYHLLVLLAEGGIEPGRIWECLAARRRGSK